MAYSVEGQLLEVCTCNVLCPCWVGEDPDEGYCESIVGWHIKEGEIEGVNVSGRTLAMLVHIPGNILDGHWKVRLYLDQDTSDEQQEGILNLWGGKLGGAITDLTSLVEDIQSVEKTDLSFDVEGVNGTIKIGDHASASIEAFKGATGIETTLHDSIFSTIPGKPAYVGKASSFKANAPGFNIDLKDHNAICGHFKFEA